jgi:hypothetical protein
MVKGKVIKMERRWMSKMETRPIMGKSGELGGIAAKLFSPVGKNPYFRGEKAIKNFRELKENLNEFTEKEAQWVASWIEYLGDAKTATRIRQTPSKFRDIILARFNELKSYAH